MFSNNPASSLALPGGDDGDAVRLPEEVPFLFLREQCRAALRKWKLLLLFGTVGGLAGLGVAAYQPRLYHASTTLEFQGISDNLLTARDGAAGSGADSELMDLQTQIRIMQSGRLLERVRAHLGPNLPARAWDATVNSLTVRTAGQTRIIEISANAVEPHLASSFVNTLADEFMTEHVEARWQGTQRATEKLRTALDDVRSKLEHSESALQKYARDSGLVFNADRSSVSEDKLRQLQTELSQVEGERVARQSRWDAISKHTDADLPSIASTPAIESAQAKLTDLRRQIAELNTTYTPDYPKVKRLEAQIAPLEASIAKEVAAIKRRAGSEFNESKHREELLSSAYRAQSHLVSDEAEKKVHYDVLRHEAESTRTLYETMLARVKESALASTMRGSNVRILDPARVPDHPFQPRWFQLTLLGSVAGVFVGGMLSFNKRPQARVIEAPGDLALAIEIPELGAIPSGSLAPWYPSAVHQVITSLLFSAPAAVSRALVVTSAHAGEGKTLVAEQLAGALAAIGKSVLLIDGNFQAPREHPLQQTADRYGMADLLLHGSWLGANEWGRAIHPTALPHLHVIPAGNLPKLTSTLVYSPRLREVLDFARKNFEIILIDTPPLLQMPEARVWGKASDAVLLVARAGSTTRNAARAVCQRLAEDGTAMAGCVLNDWNPRKHPGFPGGSLPGHAFGESRPRLARRHTA